MMKLQYPKPLMSITELVELGFSRRDLKNYTQLPDFPCVRTQGGGKILVQTDGLDEWIEKYQEKVARAIRINRKTYRFKER